MKRILSWIAGGLLVAGLVSAAEIGDLSTTDASNTARFPEGMAPSAVNDAARALEGLVARGLRDTVDGYVLTAGTSSALTVAANRTVASYYDGLTQTVEWHTTPNASATVNIDSVGAKSLVWPNGTAVGASELVSGARAIIQYDSALDKFQILSLQTPFTNPLTTRGDIMYATASSSSARLALGAAGTAPVSDGTDLAYAGILKQGKHTVWLPAGSMIARTTSGAAIGSSETTTNKVMLRTLDFDTSQQEFAQFQIGSPTSWNLGTVSAQFNWTAGGGTGTVQWYIQCAAVSDDDAMDASWGTAQGVTDTLIAANDNHLTDETDGVTCAGTPAQKDLLLFQVYRNVAGDTLTSDAKLLGVRLYMTVNQPND